MNFENTSAIDDEVLRREMRQLEGSYLSNPLLERSKERLQRLPYIEEVKFETQPVPGTPDLVDVSFDVKEGLPGQFSGGIGYSESQGAILNGSFVHSNFMGSGERVAAEIAGGQYSKVYSFTHTDPYTTIDGVARTIGVQYRDITQYVSAASDFSTTTKSVSLEFGYPISEFQGLRFGVIAQQSDLIVSPNGSAPEAVEWVRNNGNPYTQIIENEFPDGGDTDTDPDIVITTLFGSKFDTYELVTGWFYDSRNRAIFADRGMRHSVSLAVTALAARSTTTSSTTITCSCCRSGGSGRSRCLANSRLVTHSAMALPRCRRTGSSSRVDRRRCAAIPRAGSGRRTDLATPTAAT